MGASQSNNTRRITVPNEDPTSVIKVSDSVVKRLKGSEVEEESLPQSPVSQPQSDVHQVTSPHSPFYYGRGFPITSLEIRQEKEAALRDNDDYWQNRIRRMEENHMKINKRMEEEYKKAAKEIECLFANSPGGQHEKPCTAAAEYVKNCYKQNPREVLKCSKEVEAFAACVDVKRVCLLDSRQ